MTDEKEIYIGYQVRLLLFGFGGVCTVVTCRYARVALAQCYELLCQRNLGGDRDRKRLIRGAADAETKALVMA